MEREVRDLKQELAMHDVLATKGATAPGEPYSPEVQYEIQKVARNFLEGKTEDIEELSSVK
jgi:hypothetical protein